MSRNSPGSNGPYSFMSFQMKRGVAWMNLILVKGFVDESGCVDVEGCGGCVAVDTCGVSCDSSDSSGS